MRIASLSTWFLAIAIAGCLAQPSEPADPDGQRAVAASALAAPSPGELSPRGFCAISFCDLDGHCPDCFGQPGVCGPDSICSYGSGGGGGGGGGGGSFCNAAFCNDVTDCASICPQSQNPQCVNGVCQY